jgi:integrase
MFPIFDDFDYTRGNERWKGKSKRTVEQRRGDKADRLFEKLVKGTDFERLDGYHALRHSFISILVAQGKTWDQIAAFVGHLDQKTTQRYIHFMPKTSGRQRIRFRSSSDWPATCVRFSPLGESWLLRARPTLVFDQ